MKWNFHLKLLVGHAAVWARALHAQVWQVRNPTLWQKYQVHKRMMQQKLGRDTECWLWHGAAEEAIACIIKEGFNRSYSGLNGIHTSYMYSAQYSDENTQTWAITDSLTLETHSSHIFTMHTWTLSITVISLCSACSCLVRRWCLLRSEL